MRITEFCTKVTAMAADAEMKVDDFMRAACIMEKEQAAEEQARRSTPDDKAKILAWVNGQNGNLSPDLTPSEIVAQAGVVAKQGTRAVAARALKQALLTHQAH